ncbi:MAG: hypothetical protein JWQ23_4379 [Herminiimonas sp.]|nr:hypothetical protein [Herminiimonas sp.]
MNVQALFVAMSLMAGILSGGCSSGGNGNGGDDDGPVPLTRLSPAPSLQGELEVGGGIALGGRTDGTRSTTPPGASGMTDLQTVADGIPGDDRIAPLSTADPGQVLGRSTANQFKPKNKTNASLVKGLENKPLPTGKWSKGFFYQSPTDLNAYFEGKPAAGGQSADPLNNNDVHEYSVFAFPNKLWLDDRIGMVTVTFPKLRSIAIDRSPDSDLYDLSNPFLRDYVLYTITPDSRQDVRLSYLADGVGRLPRQIDRFDELTVATSWRNSAGDKAMQLIAAEGSPYITVRYAGLRPVVQVGERIYARRQKDPGSNNDVPGTEAYTEWEGVNQIAAVAVDENPLQEFVERGPVAVRRTPLLAGTKFRIVYRIADDALTPPGTNDNTTPATPIVFKELVVYASRLITLEWNPTLRSYVAAAPFDGVLRTAFVDDIPEAAPGVTLIGVSDIASFRARRGILDRYAQTYPVLSEVHLQYDGGSKATVKFRWAAERMDKAAVSADGLLMMGFDKTHIASLVDPAHVALTYRSNFGQMSAVAGSEWTQVMPVPAILQSGASEKQLWFGAREIKQADRPALIASLNADTELFKTNIAHCNYESYLCGKYLHNITRAVLIADQLGETRTRDALLVFLKQTLQPWFDAEDPLDPTYATNPIKDNFLFDRTNGGTITLRGAKKFDDDFYNGLYIDHMFHYGYFIYASAVLSRYDAAWFARYREKVNTLVRDIANPSLSDPHYPVIRTYDWFRMQNFADSGPDANGANTESSSESINSNYALVLWGVVTENPQFQALAAIMTAGEIRTAQAFYQVTPRNSVFQDIVIPTVSVKLPAGNSTVQLKHGSETSMGIIYQDITQTNVFFGSLLTYRVGIQLLPISPISEYVISREWAATHAATLKAMEAKQTELFDSVIATPPTTASACFKAGYGDEIDKTGKPVEKNVGAICASPLQTLYSWRQIFASVNGLNDPTGAYQRYTGYMDNLAAAESTYRSNTDPALHPGASLNSGGIVSDVLKSVATPSTNTNVLWWLSAQKP